MNKKRQPIEPNGNLKDDLFFWIREYIGSKVLKLTPDKKHRDKFNRNKSYKHLMGASDMENFKTIQLEIRRNGLSSLASYVNPLAYLYGFLTKHKRLERLTDFDTNVRDSIFIKNEEGYKEKTQENFLIQINSLIKYIEDNGIDADGNKYSFFMGRSRSGKKTVNPIQKKFDEVASLEPKEFLRFIKDMDSYRFRIDNPSKVKLMMKIASFGGLRGEELTSLGKNDVDLVKNPTDLLVGEYYRIYIHGKGNKERYVYIRKSLLEKDYENYLPDIGKCDNGLLFCTTKNKKYSPSAIHDIVGRLLYHAGIDKGTSGVHLLRRSYATYLATKNVDFAIISSLLGHEDLEVTELYVSISQKGLRDVVKMWDEFE
jgi:site-specific recombinase XerD